MKTFWRRLRRDFFCVNRGIWIAFAATAVLLGAVFALGGMNRHVLGYLLFPRGALPPFAMVLLWGVMLSLLGTAAALVCTGESACRASARNTILLLFLSALVLCYVWIPLVYKAASFFLALLVLAVLFFCLAAIFMTVWREHSTAAVLLCFFALWIAYLFYYTFSLFLLN